MSATGGDRAVGRWIAGWSVMLLVTVMIGGITRLTNSGLSITEWKPITGVVPPIGAEAWETEFAKYRRIPEYTAEHSTMDLAGFKRIYLWEYFHRVWARVVGIGLLVPMVVFWRRGALDPPLKRRALLLVLLVAFQAALGWFMVSSGLTVRTDVSHYRLAAHLGVALAIVGLTVAPAARLLGWMPDQPDRGVSRPIAVSWLALVTVTIVAGALVAGLDAGKMYNEFPLMGGRWIPAGYGRLTPWWANPLDNEIAVQFNHRLLAVLTVVTGGWLGVVVARRGDRIGRWLGWLIAGGVGLQLALGITTLVLSVPIPLAVAHQGLAVAVFALGVILACREHGPGYRFVRGGHQA
ncbi:MAG: COX15/CtaA family protein [Gemmatimonadales bacterium]